MIEKERTNLPMNSRMEDVWIRFISKETGQTEFGNDDIICSKHFSKECFTLIDGITVLKPVAIPFVKLGSPEPKRIRMDEHFKSCSVFSCMNISNGVGKLKADIIFHQFPKDIELANKWKLFCKPSNENYSTSYICSDHFTSNDYISDSTETTKDLRTNAIPSIHKDQNIGCDEQSISVTAQTSQDVSDEIEMEYHSKNQHFVKEEIKEEKEDIIQNKSKRSFRKRANLEEKTILIKLYEEGKSITECANAIGLNISTAKSIIRRYKEDGEELIQRPWGGNRRSILTTELLEIIENLIEKTPEITLREMEILLTKMGHVMSKSTIHNALLSMKLTVRIAQSEEELMNSVSAILNRKSFSTDFIENHPQNLEKCIFIDDCGYNIHLRKSQGRGRNASVILAMNNKRIIHHRIYTTLTLNINRFLVFLEELVQYLAVNEDMNGAWVIMNNEQVYNNNQVKATLSSASYVQKILPSFSPDYNPVRKMFFKIKHEARNLFNDDQNEDKMAVNIIDDTIKLLSSSDCSKCVKDAMGEYRRVLTENMSDN